MDKKKRDERGNNIRSLRHFVRLPNEATLWKLFSSIKPGEPHFREFIES